MTYIVLPGGRATIPKSVGAGLRYGLELADVLTPSATLTGTPTATAPAGITVGAASYTGTVVSALISGGTAGQSYAVTFGWTMSTGETDSRTIYLEVEVR